MIGEPPVLLGSVQVKATDSCRTSTMLGGGGASGTSKQYLKSAVTLKINITPETFFFNFESYYGYLPNGCFAMTGSDLRPSPTPYLFSALILNVYSFPS